MINRSKFSGGVTLVEALVAMSIMAVTALGALSYQYHAARHGHLARQQMTATRTAQLLLEDWKSTGGDENYNPTELGLGFSSPLPVPSGLSFDSEPTGATLHNAVYTITVDGLPMLVMLKWADIPDPYGISEISLRELAVIVSIDKSIVSSADGNTTRSGAINIPPIILSTYVRIDGASG